MAMDKMKMRRMAMEKMMGESPMPQLKKKKPMGLDLSSLGDDEEGEGDDMAEIEMEGMEKDDKGFVTMKLSPSETKMIMLARKKSKPAPMEMGDEDQDEEYA